MELTDFEVLTFDCYGTLIDWEAGLLAALRPLLERSGVGLTDDEVLEAYARHEAAQQAETPNLIYPQLLARTYRSLATGWGVAPSDAEADAFGASVKDWPAFPDSAEALAYLERHYRLVVLSNVDRASFAASNAKLGVRFDAVYTAEEIGSYKPDRRNFEYMLARLGEMGVDKAKILHTAQSLFHDHEPAVEIGLATAWIDRRHDREGWGATRPPGSDVRTDFRFTSLAGLADRHRALIGA